MEKNHIDNLYLAKKLKEDYRKAFDRFYSYILSAEKSDADTNILTNIALFQCLEGMENNRKPAIVIPKDLKAYTSKISRSSTYKEMRRKICKQDYERLHISSIWYLFSLCIVLFFFKNLLDNHFMINYMMDGLIACIAGGFALKNFLIRKRIIDRYSFGSYYLHMDIVALLACVFIKIITPAAYVNFDITYLLLVISFFVMKKKIKPQFEAIIQ